MKDRQVGNILKEKVKQFIFTLLLGQEHSQLWSYAFPSRKFDWEEHEMEI